MKEIWKDIIGYEGFYQVSNMGRVKSIDREFVCFNGWVDIKRQVKGKILAISKQSQGYSQVSLCKNGIQKSCRLNRLVAIAFVPNPECKPEVNHIDGNKDNNCAENLEWVTSKENIRHAIKTGLVDRSCKRKPVLQIDESGNIVAEFDSIKSAAKATGLQSSTICCICKRRKYYIKTGGFYWRYKNE